MQPPYVSVPVSKHPSLSRTWAAADGPHCALSGSLLAGRFSCWRPCLKCVPLLPVVRMQCPLSPLGLLRALQEAAETSGGRVCGQRPCRERGLSVAGDFRKVVPDGAGAVRPPHCA